MQADRRPDSHETAEAIHLVSARFLTDFFGALERSGTPVLELLGDLPVPLDEHRQVRAAIEWDVFCEVMRRLGHALGGTAGLEQCGETLEVLAPSRALAGLAASPQILYSAASGWVLRRALPGIETSCRPVDGSRLEIHARIADGLRACPEIFHFATGGARVLPRTIGLRDAVVTADVPPGEARYRIALPPSPTLLARATRLFRTIFSAGSVLRYLEAQQLELHAKNDALERANAALAESERRYRALTETAVDVLCELDADGRVVYVSSSIRELIGYSREQVTGSHYRLWVPRAHRAAADEGVRRLLDMPEGCSTQERVTLHASGGRRAVAEFTARSYDTLEGERRLVMIVRDLHDRRRGARTDARPAHPERSDEALARTGDPTRALDATMTHLVERAVVDRSVPLERGGAAAWHETAKLLQSALEGFRPEAGDDEAARAVVVELADAPDEIWIDEALFTTTLCALLDAVATLRAPGRDDASALRIRMGLEAEGDEPTAGAAGRLLIRVSGAGTRGAEGGSEETRRSLDLAAGAAAALGGRLMPPDADDADFRLALPQPIRTTD